MKKKKKLLVLFLFVFTILSFFKAPIISHAIDSSSSNSSINNTSTALEDLQKNPDFDKDSYLVNISDYSMNVIQIAESSKQLFIYTYQPSNPYKALIATSISMSYLIEANLNYHVYSLNLINTDGVFNKYVVKDFTVRNDSIRYYDISTIYRVYDKLIDGPHLPFLNERNEVGSNVGQLWSAMSVDGVVTYCMVENETISITDKYVGFIRYFEGVSINILLGFLGYTDSHFVAFSTDKKIDTLYEVQIGYVTQSYLEQINYAMPELSGTELGEEVAHNETIKADQIVESTSKNWLAAKYKWGRIQTKDEFLTTDGDSLKDEVKTEINNKQFVVRFYESPFTHDRTGSVFTEKSTRVSDVVILRLKFKTEGIVYNLGVVDNKDTGSSDPSGVDLGGLDELGESLKYILMIVALILLLVLVGPFIPTILNVVTIIFKTIFKVISYPFKWIAGLFDKGRDK